MKPRFGGRRSCSARKRKRKTIERALEEVITERERIRAAWQAHEQFLKSGIQIRDVYGVLEDPTGI